MTKLMRIKMPNDSSYKAKALAAFFGILAVVSIAIWQLDIQRHAGIPPKISVEPDTLTMKLNLSETIIKLVKIKFEENPVKVDPSLHGPGLAKFVNLIKYKDSDKTYSLFANATNPANNKQAMSLEGYIQLDYSFVDKKPYDKTIPLEVSLSNRNATRTK